MRRKFAASGVNHKWYGDGTEIAAGEGKLFLGSVPGMASRRIVGRALGGRHDAVLSVAALLMAAGVRGGSVRGMVFHFDYADVGVKPESLRMAWSGSPGEGFSGLEPVDKGVVAPETGETVSMWLPSYGTRGEAQATPGSENVSNRLPTRGPGAIVPCLAAERDLLVGRVPVP